MRRVPVIGWEMMGLVRLGASCRWRWEPTGLSKEELTERGLMVEDVSWPLQWRRSEA